MSVPANEQEWFLRQSWSFRKSPGRGDTIQYGKVLLLCASGNNAPSPAEREWVTGYTAAKGAPYAVCEELHEYNPQASDLQEILRNPALQPTRRALLYDAIRACSSDGPLNDAELAALTNLAAKLDIPEDELKQYFDLFNQEEALQQRRVKACFPDGIPAALAIPGLDDEPKERARDWYYKSNWSFCQSPKKSDTLTYGKALIICANGDGELSDIEREWIVGYSATKGAAPKEIQALQKYVGTPDDLEALLKSSDAVQRSRRALVYDATRAAKADGDLNAKEWATIVRLAGFLGLSDAEATDLRQIAEAEFDLQQKKVHLCFPDGIPH